MAFYANAPLPDLNARQVAQTIRLPSTSLLAIDSEDQYTDYSANRASVQQTPYNFTISKNESIMNGFFTRLAVTEIIVPWTIPNINTKTSTIMASITVGAGPPTVRQISLTPGFYTPFQLATAMTKAIVDLSGSIPTIGSFSMTYGIVPAVPSSREPLFAYFTNSPGTTISFAPMTPNSAAYRWPASAKQLFDVLGFGSQNQIADVANTGGTTFCQAIRYLDVICNQLTYNQALKDTMSQPVVHDTLCRVYLVNAGSLQTTVSPNDPTFAPPGTCPTTFYKEYAMPKQIQWQPNMPIPGYLNFSILDDTGAPLEESDPFRFGSNKTNWSMTLLVSEV